MATYRKRGLRWRAEVRRRGVYQSDSFSTKAEAVAWATRIESDIDSGKYRDRPCGTFGDLLMRYAADVSPTKRGARWEQIRVRAITDGRHDPIADVELSDMAPRHVGAWRDRRLAQVSAATVRREWQLLSNVCAVAVREWGLLKDNPFSGVRRPKPSAARDRRISDEEIERILWCLGYTRGEKIETQSARVAAAFLWAIETAMRAGEICALEWTDLDTRRRFCRIRSGKTRSAIREVPLTAEALRISEQLAEVRDGPLVFGLRTTILDALFRKAKARAMVDDLHFHDTRHEGITRLSKSLHVLALARSVGIGDLRILQVYYNERAEDLAALLP